MCDLVTAGNGSSVGGPGEEDLATRSASSVGILLSMLYCSLEIMEDAVLQYLVHSPRVTTRETANKVHHLYPRRSPVMTAPRQARVLSVCDTAIIDFAGLILLRPVTSTTFPLRMSSNVGLTTPRGSGTSGYVQRNLSHFKPRDNFAPYPKDYDSLKHRQRKPDREILDHDRLREIEVKVFDLRDKLEDEGYVARTLSPSGIPKLLYY